jgi:hypothetical protein
MKSTRRSFVYGTVAAGFAAASTLSRAELGSVLGIGEGLEDFWLATDAYIYGYSLVTMEMTRRVMTNVAAPVGTRGPMGTIIKYREYPNASFKDVTARMPTPSIPWRGSKSARSRGYSASPI